MELSYGQTSFAQCGEEHLTLRLSAELFEADRWAAIQAWFQTQGPFSHWLNAPFRVMTAEEDLPDYPRWKQVWVDPLSWVIFHLLVPPGHALVKLWRTIDWAAINRLCAPIYENSQSGQRAWAPAQLFALLLLFFMLPVASECGLLRLVAIVPLYRWFCGFGMFTILPHHSTLHTFRKNVGVARFEAILTLVVLCCLETGLVANELAYFDMMGVAASARAWTPYERAVLLTQALLRYLELAEKGKAPHAPLPEALRQLMAEVAIEVLDNKRLNQDAKAPRRVLSSVERWNRRQQEAKGQALWEMALEEAVQTLLVEEASQTEEEAGGGKKEARPTPEAEAAKEAEAEVKEEKKEAPPTPVAEGAQETEAQAEREETPSLPQEPKVERRWLKETAQRLKDLLPHARGDVDARVAWTSHAVLLCGYWLGFLVDGLRGVITAVRVVPLNIAQQRQMIPALAAHQERVKAYPKAVAADSAQDYYPVHQALDERQIQGHIASRRHQGRGGGLGAQHFTWGEQGQLLCPAGKVMPPGKPRRDGLTPHQAQAVDCAACSRKAECLPQGQQPEGPRVIHLDPPAHQRWLRNRDHTRTEAYKIAQKKRFASEGWFGLAERLYGADKMPYRSTPMNQVAGLMIGIAMNLALLTRHREDG
jgi:transposase